MSNIANPHLREAHSLFARAEAESNPSRKFAALDEALELVESVLGDSSLPESDHEFAQRLNRAHIHRLMSQLVVMHNLDYAAWFLYIELSFMRPAREASSVLKEDASLMAGYETLLNTWRRILLKPSTRPPARGA